DKAGTLAWQSTMGDQAAVEEVDKLLTKANLTKETVHAQAMAMNIETFATFERLIWAAEARRDASLRKIEYHRAPFGQKLRRAIPQVEKDGAACISWELRSILMPREESENFALAVSNLARQLGLLERYERRALSRRKKAFRRFDIEQRKVRLAANRKVTPS